VLICYGTVIKETLDLLGPRLTTRTHSILTLGGRLDAYYVSDLNARQFITGYAFTIGSSLVSWKVIVKTERNHKKGGLNFDLVEFKNFFINNMCITIF